MAKDRRVYVCRECGAQFVSWAGQCAQCDGWATIEEASVAAPRSAADIPNVEPLSQFDVAGAVPIPTGLDEVDRVLGGGLVPSSVSLLGGEPGIGKSTLSLQMAMSVAAAGSSVLVITGEEAPTQVAARAGRLGSIPDELSVVDTTDVDGPERAELFVKGAAAEIVAIGVADDEVAFGHRNAEAGLDQAPLHRIFDLDVLTLWDDDLLTRPDGFGGLDDDPFGFDDEGDEEDGLDGLDEAGGFDIVDDTANEPANHPPDLAAEPFHQRHRHSQGDTHLSADANALLLVSGAADDPVVVADDPTAYTFVAPDRVAVSATDGSLRILHLDADEWWTVDGALRPPSRIVALDCRASDLAADDRWLALAGDDRVIRLWHLPDLLAGTGDAAGDDEPLDPALQLFVAADGEWVLWSTCGAYTSSPGGDRYLLHVVSDGDAERPRAYSSDRFFDQLYRPYLIEAIIAEGSEDRARIVVGEDQSTTIDDLRMVTTTDRLEIEPVDAATVGVQHTPDFVSVDQPSESRIHRLRLAQPFIRLRSVEARRRQALDRRR